MVHPRIRVTFHLKIIYIHNGFHCLEFYVAFPLSCSSYRSVFGSHSIQCLRISGFPPSINNCVLRLSRMFMLYSLIFSRLQLCSVQHLFTSQSFILVLFFTKNKGCSADIFGVTPCNVYRPFSNCLFLVLAVNVRLLLGIFLVTANIFAPVNLFENLYVYRLTHALIRNIIWWKLEPGFQ